MVELRAVREGEVSEKSASLSTATIAAPAIEKSSRSKRAASLRVAVPVRICAQPNCGFILGPQNRSGYCAKHSAPSDRSERRFCAEPECGQRLRSDNTTEFCFAHRVQKSRASVTKKTCIECGKLLHANNLSGFCTNHFHLGRPSHARALAKAAAQAKCNEPGCEKAANKNGYCPRHRWAKNRPSVKPQVCKEPDCGVSLKSNNSSGFCRKHLYLAHPRARKHCQEPHCQAVLGNNNKSGFCPVHWMKHYGAEHRDAQRVRAAEWKTRQQVKLATAERKAWRPIDWNAKKKASWRPIAEELLSREEHTPNEDLAEKLQMQLSQYGHTPREIARSRGFVLLVNRVRNWVGRQGRAINRRPSESPVNSHISPQV